MTLPIMATAVSLAAAFFRTPRALDVIGGLLLVAILSLLGSALVQSEYWRARRAAKRSPRRLFDELASVHRLSPSQRRTCREVAAELALEETVTLFVRTDARKTLARRDAALAAKLYGEDAGPSA